jgi:hypothetical protein
MRISDLERNLKTQLARELRAVVDGYRATSVQRTSAPRAPSYPVFERAICTASR